MKNKKLIKILDKYCQDNNITEIKIGLFSGGNDSGGCSFLTGLEEIEDDLSNICENQLNYGSWAGNFDSSGDIWYNSETKTITIAGEELDYENVTYVKTKDIPVNFEKFNFDSLQFYINGKHIVISYNITSGFITKEMENYLEKIKEEVNNIELYKDQEIYKDAVILKKDLISNPNLELEIKQISRLNIYYTINLLEDEN